MRFYLAAVGRPSDARMPKILLVSLEKSGRNCAWLLSGKTELYVRSWVHRGLSGKVWVILCTVKIRAGMIHKTGIVHGYLCPDSRQRRDALIVGVAHCLQSRHGPARLSSLFGGARHDGHVGRDLNRRNDE